MRRTTEMFMRYTLTPTLTITPDTTLDTEVERDPASSSTYQGRSSPHSDL